MSINKFRQHTYTPNEYYDYLRQVELGMSGDIEVGFLSEKLEGVELDGTSLTVDSQTVDVALVDDEGNVHEWFDGELAVEITTSENGVADDGDGNAITSVDLVDGVGEIEIHYSGDWDAGETVSVKVGDNDEILGYGDFDETETVLEVAS